MPDTNLEDRVKELESLVRALYHELTGVRLQMRWGHMQYGNDGFQIVGDRNLAIDCPELGFSVIHADSDSMEDNSIGKVSGRWNGNELSLYQQKRARGYSHSYGPEVGMHQWSCNIGGGSGDPNMFDNLFLLPDKLVSKVPIEAPGIHQSIGGTYALRSMANGMYVCADAYENRPLLANRNVVGQWEQFELVKV